ncbi:hypothetical protein Q8A73_008842 [Channa argus]|nr:hypothetical protein Q8A73_008842 [Channa argus]
MQNSTALFGMVSHCQTPAFPDFTGLTFSVYGSKSDICARRAGNGGFGSQICRSPYDTPIHMNCVSPKRLSAPEEKAHLSTTTPRSCFSLPQVQALVFLSICFCPYRSSFAFQRTLPGASPGLGCGSTNGASSSLPYLIKQEKSMRYKISSTGSGVHSVSQTEFQNCRASQVLEVPRDKIVVDSHANNNVSGVCTSSKVSSAVSGDAVQPFNNEDNSSPLALSPADSHHSARLLSDTSLKRHCLASQSNVAASTGSVTLTSSPSVTGAASEDINITAIIYSSSQMSAIACVNGFHSNLSPRHTSSASFSSSSSSSSTSPPSNDCSQEAPQRPPPHGSPQQASLHESCQLSSSATCLLSHSSFSSSSSSVSSLEQEQGQGHGLCEEQSSMLQGCGSGGVAGGGVGGGGGSDGLGPLMSGALMSGMLHLGPEAGALLDGSQRSRAVLKQEPLDDFPPSEEELFQQQYHHHLSGRSGNLRHSHHPPRPAMPPPYHTHQYVGASPGGQLLQQTSQASALVPKPSSGGPPGSHTAPDREAPGGGTLADKQVCRWIDCSAVYEQQEELVRHIEKVHIDQRKGEDFTCFWAGCIRRYKPFNARYKLLIHMRVHSGEKPNKCMKPYACQIPGCTKRYTDPSSLRKHVKIHTAKEQQVRRKLRPCPHLEQEVLSDCLPMQHLQSASSAQHLYNCKDGRSPGLDQDIFTGLYVGSSTPHHSASVELLSPNPNPNIVPTSTADLSSRQHRLDRELCSPHHQSPLAAMDGSRDGVPGPLLSPGMKATGTPPPHPLEKQHVHTHHKPISQYHHHQTASDEYQGSFQSCLHFGDSYRMEQTIGGVHVPGDSHAYTSHQHNGFHMSTANTASAGFSLTQELQGNPGCQFSASTEESIFFQVGSFDRSLSHVSSIYTET